MTVAMVAAVSLVLGACGRSFPGGPGAGLYAPNDLVLRVEQVGGFVAPLSLASRFAQISLYGDGRIVQPGPQMEIYPGPALPSIALSRVDRDGFERILAAAHAAGLLGPDRHVGGPAYPDMPTTVVSFFDGEARHTVTANEPRTGVADPIVPFLRHMADLARWLPKGTLTDEGQLPIERLAVLVSSQPPGELVPEPEIEWPLATSPSAMARPVAGSDLPCLSLSGPQLASVLPLAERANQLTPWTSGSSRVWLMFRPLLPDERSCLALGVRS
jgi:hypothetical protein